MKCEWVQENILLYVYNELADDARYELEQHLGRCPECAAELKSARAFHGALSKLPVMEPTPNLLAASRMRLQEALETAPQGGWWQRLTFDPASWLRQVRFSPALAAVIFMVGFGGGIGAMYKMMPVTDVPVARVDTTHSIRRSSFDHRYSLRSSGTRLRPRQHQVRHSTDAGSLRHRLTTSASSNYSSSQPAATTVPAFAWIRSIY